MIQSKLKMIGLFALVLITSGCATTSFHNNNDNWTKCSLTDAQVGGVDCVIAGDGTNDSHHMARSTMTDQIRIMFNFDSYRLGSNDKKALDKIADMADLNTGIQITGHTCNIGASTYNQNLSVKRANAVRDYLVSKGVMSASIQAEGKGESASVADNNTREGRAKNRQAEVEVYRTKAARHHREKPGQFRGAAMDPYLIYHN